MSNNLFHHEEIYRGSLKAFNKDILICGCGAVGSNLIDNLSRTGFSCLSVLDKDRIEKHNINTQVWNTNQVGMLKTSAMEQLVYDNTNTILQTKQCELTKSNIKKLFGPLGGHKLIVDGFDNTVARQLVTDYCTENKIHCLHVGLFEDFAEVRWNKNYKVPQVKEGLDVCDYPLARNIILLATVVATEEIIKFCQGKEKNNWTITLKDLKITKGENDTNI